MSSLPGTTSVAPERRSAASADALFVAIIVASLAAAAVALALADARRGPLIAFAVFFMTLLGVGGLVFPRVLRRAWANRVPTSATIVGLEGLGGSQSTSAIVRFTPPGGIEREGRVRTNGRRGLTVGQDLIVQYNADRPDDLTLRTLDDALRQLRAQGIVYGVITALGSILVVFRV